MLKLRSCIRPITIKQLYYYNLLVRNSVSVSRSGHSRYDLDEQEYENANFSKKLKMFKEAIVYDFKNLKKNINAYKNNKFRYFHYGEKVKMFKFDNPESLDNWVVSMDSSWKEGFSTASFTYNSRGYATFSGNLDSNTLPKTGYIDRVGWVNIMNREPPEFFRSKSLFQLEEFTHLVLKVRGDGRTYIINFSDPGFFDITFLNLYSYSLFTHGGPYWQNVKIPLSKFILTNGGQICELQNNFKQADISSIGITLMDRYSGPFNLDIDYIGVEYDIRNLEKEVYETFQD